MKRYGLIGRTLAHSFSARYFTEKFRREGLDKEYSYELFELPEIGCVEKLINDTPDLAGFNVTIPYKQQIIPHLDRSRQLCQDCRRAPHGIQYRHCRNKGVAR